MSEPFIGQVTLFAFPYAPKGWAECSGQEIPITQNPTLYSLLGSTYGGDDRTVFKLPDFRSRTMLGAGYGKYPNGQPLTPRQRGEWGGTETTESPVQHSHVLLDSPAPEIPLGSGKGTQQGALNGYLADGSCDVTAGIGRQVSTGPVNFYAGTQGTQTIKGDLAVAVEPTGSPQVNNMQPYTVVNYCISLTGLFPPRD